MAGAPGVKPCRHLSLLSQVQDSEPLIFSQSVCRSLLQHQEETYVMALLKQALPCHPHANLTLVTHEMIGALRTDKLQRGSCLLTDLGEPITPSEDIATLSSGKAHRGEACGSTVLTKLWFPMVFSTGLRQSGSTSTGTKKSASLPCRSIHPG